MWAPLDLWCLPHVPSRQHGPVLWRRAAGRDSREHLPRRYRPPSTPSPSAHLDHFACAVAFGPSVNAGPGFGRACECSCPAVEHRHRRPVVGAALCARARAVRLVALRPRRWRRTATRGWRGDLAPPCLFASIRGAATVAARRAFTGPSMLPNLLTASLVESNIVKVSDVAPPSRLGQVLRGCCVSRPAAWPTLPWPTLPWPTLPWPTLPPPS